MPLTASLYVPGTLDEADKVLVDVGTGYFIEVSFGGILYLINIHFFSSQKKIEILSGVYMILFTERA